MQGKDEGEGAPLLHLAFHPDPPSVHLDEPAGQGEAQAGAGLLTGNGIAALVEVFEDSLLIREMLEPGYCSSTTKWS